MVQKRPFDEGESLERSSKFPRLPEGNERLVSFSESVFPEYASQDPHISEDRFTKADSKSYEKVSEPGESIQNIDTCPPSYNSNSNSNSSWAASSTSEEDSQLVEPFNLSFHPEVYTHDRPLRPFVLREDIYSLLLHYPPQKLVPIGPDHQAEIPPWSSPPQENLLDPLNEENILMGKCVIPMPDLDSSSSYGNEVGRGRTNCSCEDGNSFRCARQHIAEAREKLEKAIGQESFEELGFYNMGEQAGQQWSEKEEQLFYEVVFSNPASLGRNFWQSLSADFPSRTKKEIVSYYFNVFILRRRAQQNRNDSLDIDSDNDEWQGSDDFGENEHGTTEEDEDSAVESPVYHSRLDYNQHEQGDLHDFDEDSAVESPVYHSRLDYNQNEEGDLQDFDEESSKLFNTREFSGHMSKFSDKSDVSLLNYCHTSPTVAPQDETPWPESGDQELQDDSCTSSDLGTSQGTTQVWKNGLNGLSTKESQNKYTLESCNSRAWDSGFLSSFKTQVDFLPTCSVIEEVFGEDSCNYQGKDATRT